MTRIWEQTTAKAQRWLGDGLHPTLRDETAKDGALDLLWLVWEERQVRVRGLGWEDATADGWVSS